MHCFIRDTVDPEFPTSKYLALHSADTRKKMRLGCGGSSLQRQQDSSYAQFVFADWITKKCPFCTKATFTARATLADGKGIILRRGI
jgi:hypothetical protein